MSFREEQVAAFMAAFEQRQPLIAAFNGCQGVELLRATSPATIFFTYSRWESEAHLAAYRQSALFTETWATVKPWFSDKPEAWSVATIIPGPTA